MKIKTNKSISNGEFFLKNTKLKLGSLLKLVDRIMKLRLPCKMQT